MTFVREITLSLRFYYTHVHSLNKDTLPNKIIQEGVYFPVKNYNKYLWEHYYGLCLEIRNSNVRWRYNVL